MKYQYDRAVHFLGMRVESALNENRNRKKPLPPFQIIQEALGYGIAAGRMMPISTFTDQLIPLVPEQDDFNAAEYLVNRKKNKKQSKQGN